jgi:spore maturation protein SpmB
MQALKLIPGGGRLGVVGVVIGEIEEKKIRHYVANTTAVDTCHIFDNVHVMFLSGAAPWRSIFSFRRRRGR